MIRGNLLPSPTDHCHPCPGACIRLLGGIVESAPAVGGKGHAKTGTLKTTPAIQTAIRVC